MTPPIAKPSTPPTIPLSDKNRAAYQDLYDALQASMDDHASDPGAYPVLAAARREVNQVLDADNMARLHSNTTAFETLQTQIQTTNTSLETLKKQILAIDAKLATFGSVIAAATKVLSLFPL